MLKLFQIFSFPKLLLWHNSRRTYLAHLLQCVLACPAFRGWNKCWRQGKEWKKERERWGKPTLWLRGEVREFPCELDGFYIWPDRSFAQELCSTRAAFGSSTSSSGWSHWQPRLRNFRGTVSYSVIMGHCGPHQYPQAVTFVVWKHLASPSWHSK